MEVPRKSHEKLIAWVATGGSDFFRLLTKEEDWGKANDIVKTILHVLIHRN